MAATVGLLIVALPAPAHADCDNHTPGEGETVTCDTSDPNPDPENIDGGGSSSVTVNVLDGAGILTMEPSIRGGADDWVVNNAGSVVSSGSASILGSDASGWEVINSGSVVSEVATGIVGEFGSDWAIDNSGSISGGDFGIRMTSGSITNHADAEISGLTGVGLTFAANATIDNAGTIIGTGDNAISAGPDTESMELVLRGTSELQGDIELQAGSNTLSLEGSSSEDSNFAGLSQINVQAGADWTLSGNLTPLTSGTLEAHVVGTLRLDGLLEGAVQVQADGRLGGTGTVGQTTNEGTVAPGDSIGTLTVDGAYTHAADATLEVEIAPDGSSDLLDIAEAANLQGGTISVQLAPGDYAPGTEFPILTAAAGVIGEFTTLDQDNPDVPLELVHGTVTVSLVVGPETEVFSPGALVVDPEAGDLSDGNRVFEPGEQVEVAPTWQNDGEFPQFLTGTAADFAGPEGPTYELLFDEADYGEVEPGASASCLHTETCYQMGIGPPGVPRPVLHWDTVFDETLSDESVKTWTLHVGDSFEDVPRASPFYRAIETLLHSGVSSDAGLARRDLLVVGCGDGKFCPTEPHTRAQAAVFLLKAAEPELTPPPCVEDDERFADVPFDSPFCPWIEELARREITAGCGDGNYCPDDPTSRGQMAVLLLKASQGPGYTPPECTGALPDVPCPSPFADWIEDLLTRDITAGCATDPLRYCPAEPVARQQMAVFVTDAFELVLYGP